VAVTDNVSKLQLKWRRDAAKVANMRMQSR